MNIVTSQPAQTPTYNRPISLDNLFNIGLFFAVGIGFFAFNYQFRTTLIVGFIMAVLTYPIFLFLDKKLTKALPKKHGSLAGICTMVIVIGALTIFFNFIGSQIVKEIPKFLEVTSNTVYSLPNNTQFLDAVSQFGVTKEIVVAGVDQFNRVIHPNAAISAESVFSQDSLSRFFDITGQVFNIAFNQLAYLVLFLLAWFNGLVYGNRWVESLLSLLPLHDHESTQIRKDLKFGIRNVLYANLLSGVINTAVVFTMMVIFNVPNKFVIAILSFIIGFLPATPNEMAYVIPVAVIFSINPVAAVVCAILAEIIIIWINYMFLPKIILSGSEGNPLFVITSVISGLFLFGPMGFLIGPIVMIFINTLGTILLRRVRTE
jgi:predicted PurR-regulated permease PerM